MNDNPVFWEHGVFLQPQHFQLEYIQNVRRAAAAMALLNPYLWGVRRLEVNENSIANGVFERSRTELHDQRGGLEGLELHSVELPNSQST